MKTLVWLAGFSLCCLGCGQKMTEQESHNHSPDERGLQPVTYTVYTDHLELFVEFRPLIVGSKSTFAAHFTILGDNFLPLTEGQATVSLIVGENGIKNTADSIQSPGIFRLALVPNKPGIGELIFDVQHETFTDQIILDSLPVYPDESTALADQQPSVHGDEITFLKEQAWKIEFANVAVEKRPFREIIKSSGQILAAPGDEKILTANAKGIIRLSGKNAVPGSAVRAGEPLFFISGNNLAENNVNAKYLEAKTRLDKATADFERAEALINDKLISQKDYVQVKADLEIAKEAFQTIARDYSSGSYSIGSPVAGFIKNILVSDGQYVDVGDPLAMISQNKRLMLQANLSQKYFNKLPGITAATFKTMGSDLIHDTEKLQGRVVSFGKSMVANAPFIPITFEIDNIGQIIPGSAAEIFLKSNLLPEVLVVPVGALLEEQGNFYVYVQTRGESFQKKYVQTGASDGQLVQILSGLQPHGRVVTKGALQIKLSTATGQVPAHGHSH